MCLNVKSSFHLRKFVAKQTNQSRRTYSQRIPCTHSITCHEFKQIAIISGNKKLISINFWVRENMNLFALPTCSHPLNCSSINHHSGLFSSNAIYDITLAAICLRANNHGMRSSALSHHRGVIKGLNWWNSLIDTPFSAQKSIRNS